MLVTFFVGYSAKERKELAQVHMKMSLPIPMMPQKTSDTSPKGTKNPAASPGNENHVGDTGTVHSPAHGTDSLNEIGRDF